MSHNWGHIPIPRSQVPRPYIPIALRGYVNMGTPPNIEVEMVDVVGVVYISDPDPCASRCLIPMLASFA